MLDIKLPSALLMLLLPKLRILQVLVTSRRNLHAELQTFLDLHLIQQFSVFDVSALDFSNELLIGFSPQNLIKTWDCFIFFAVDELQGSMHQIS